MVAERALAVGKREIKPLRRRGPATAAERQLYAAIYSHSRLWWPEPSQDERDQDLYRAVCKQSTLRAQRLMLPYDLERDLYTTEIIPILKGYRHARIPLRCEGETWYFLDDLEGVDALLDFVRDRKLSSGRNSVPAGHFRQRLKVPLSEEYYRPHMAAFLERRGVTPARMALESRDEAWYFLDKIEDAQAVIDGLGAYQPILLPDGGALLEP